MKTRRRGVSAIVFGVCAGLFLSSGIRLVFAESGPKGPEVEAVPDLEEVIKEPGKSASDPDSESLADLEKVIEAEKDKPPPRAAKDAAPPQERDAASELEEEPVVEPTRKEEASRGKGLPPPNPELIEPDAVPRQSSRRAQMPQANGQKNMINNLEFRVDNGNSQLTVTSRYPLAYREIRNTGMKQVVYYFDNTETPDRLQRAYDTTEFKSPVALFTILQVPKESPPSSKLIVQLREDKLPTVTPNARGLTIEFPPWSGGDEPRVIAGDRDPASTAEENIYSDRITFSGKPIKRLEIKNSEVQDVLRLIAKTSGYNIVVGDDVTGKVGTLSLQNVPWDQAFALVLQSKKLGYIKQGNVIRVATLTALKSEKDEALSSEQAKIKVEQLRTVLIPISYAKAAELAPQAKNFLTERGTVDTDTRTNTIIVKDIDRVVTRVQKLISALDTQPPTVSISAKFVEMSNTLLRAIGFSQLNFNTNFSGTNIAQVQGLPVNGSSVTTLTAPQFANLSAKLELEERDSNIRTLANPSVTVVANRQATVNQSLSFFVPANEVAGGQLVASSRQVTTNLSLDVTPIVAGDGSIFLTVNIRNEVPDLAGRDTTIQARNVSTQVLLENGDTAVVGGVFQDSVNREKQGIPILMNIPVLGTLFSRSRVVNRRNEIFVFLTAKITNAEESFKRGL